MRVFGALEGGLDGGRGLGGGEVTLLRGTGRGQWLGLKLGLSESGAEFIVGFVFLC